MDELFNEYYLKIYYWAIKKTNNKEDAEDLTNNVFLAIFEYFSASIDVKKIENLVWKIAHNIWCKTAKNYIKEKNNIIYDDAIDTEYQDDLLDKIIYKEIVNGIDNIGLTKNELISFKLYYISDLSISDISKKINVSQNNIKYYLYSARKKIKERYNCE